MLEPIVEGDSIRFVQVITGKYAHVIQDPNNPPYCYVVFGLESIEPNGVPEVIWVENIPEPRRSAIRNTVKVGFPDSDWRDALKDFLYWENVEIRGKGNR